MRLYCSTKMFCIGLAVLGAGALYGHFRASEEIYSKAQKPAAPVKLLEGKINDDQALDLVIRLENDKNEIMLNRDGEYVNVRTETNDNLKRSKEDYDADVSQIERAYAKNVIKKTREYDSGKTEIERKYNEIVKELK